MKILILSISILVITIVIASCKKNNPEPHPSNAVLYNKSVSVIKSYIEGKWKINYAIGGMTGNQRIDFINSFMEFKFHPIDSIIHVENGVIRSQSRINWFPGQDIFTGTTIYFLGFNIYQSNLPFSYRISQIENDTLLVTQPVADGYTYALTKK